MNQKIAERIISDNNETDSVEKMINLKILKNFQLNIYHALACTSIYDSRKKWNNTWSIQKEIWNSISIFIRN